MEIKNVPQDKIKTYAGHKKVIYAKKNGKYVKSLSSGWVDESFVNNQALKDIQQKANQAYIDVINGTASTLLFYMYHFRHDLVSLSQTSGFFKITIKSHFKANKFCKLSSKKLEVYANVFAISAEDLKKLPEKNIYEEQNIKPKK